MNTMLKKVLMCAAAFAVASSVAFAEIDLSGMKYEELVSLNKQVTQAIMKSNEFEKVTVPRGLYKIGDDIPAGTWVLSSADKGMVSITYGTTVDGNSMNMFSRGNTNEDLSGEETWRVTLSDGEYMEISYGDVIFTSYTGTNGLGFKKK